MTGIPPGTPPGTPTGIPAGKLDGKVAVVIGDLVAPAAKQAAQDITETGGTAVALAADVSDPAQVDQAFGQVIGEFGRVDVLYNNAGVNSSGSVIDATDEDWDRSFAVNAKGTF